MSFRIGFLLLCMFSASVRIATAAAFTQSGSIPVPAFPLAGGCTLSNGRTISNFRAVGIATGGAILPANVAGLADFGGDASTGPPSTFPAPGSGTLTFQYAYTITPSPGDVFNRYLWSSRQRRPTRHFRDLLLMRWRSVLSAAGARRRTDGRELLRLPAFPASG